MNSRWKEEYERWVKYAVEDEDIVKELQEIGSDETKMEDAFYRELAFGTGGLRGVIGAGTNRMNIYTVAKASQGLADYINDNFDCKDRSIAISYDSRIKSDLFARVAASVFAANDIIVYIYPELMPTPCLSFAVRKLKCAAGVMVTASHNPAKYNGYKVYGNDGCQITMEAANKILNEIGKIDLFVDIKRTEFEQGLREKKIFYIEDSIWKEFVEAVKSQSLTAPEEKVNKNVSIVYSPLNGTGRKPVLCTLKEAGYKNIVVVKEQEMPDGTFPTCPYPNPEIEDAMKLGLEYARKVNAELLLATDPDCDRVGIAVKKKDGQFVLLSGNETGILLLDYICSRRQEKNLMPENPVLVKTIVTTDMAEKIAESYGVQTINVLTGFKYIGEQIGQMEAKGAVDNYIFGFEESYGYLSGSYVRDKDAVNGAFLICEMFAYYNSKGIGLWEKLEELYHKYGYCLNTLHSYQFEGSAGLKKMQEIMRNFREGVTYIGEKKVVEFQDYCKGINNLPKSDVLKFKLEDGCSVVIRPSGTEPKMKVYLYVSAKNRESASIIEKEIIGCLEQFFI